jgi:hypothetical protein
MHLFVQKASTNKTKNQIILHKARGQFVYKHLIIIYIKDNIMRPGTCKCKNYKNVKVKVTALNQID